MRTSTNFDPKTGRAARPDRRWMILLAIGGVAVVRVERNESRLLDPVVREDLVRLDLVHRQGGRKHTRPHVRDAGEFEQALHRTVLAERAVENRKNDYSFVRRSGCDGGQGFDLRSLGADRRR